MNERIKELRKQVKVDMHLHNVEDIKAMEGCFGFEGGNKIVIDYIEKFAELIVQECAEWIKNTDSDPDIGEEDAKALLEHFGVKE